MKRLFVILISLLLLLHLSQFSAEIENVKLNSPRNAICACVGETLNYTCTIAVDPGSPTGSTVWSGSAFMCVGNEISLIHDRFDDRTPASGGCNGGDIVARSVGIEGMNYTSELDVTVRDGLNDRVVTCSWDTNPGPGLSSIITVASACGGFQPIVDLSVSPGQLTFNWTQLDSKCSTVTQYRIISDCGNCSGSVTDETSATCSELQLSETETNCTFSVQGMSRGFTGTPSNLITVILKVPGPPQFNITPVYNSEQQLINLIAEICPVPHFSIYKGQISGAIENYTIHYSPSVNITIPAEIDCRNYICGYTFDVPSSECPSSNDDSITVSFSAANRLGPGRQGSEPASIDCINKFVSVTISKFTLICQFLNNKSSAEKTCSVKYRVCGQEEVFTSEGNSTLDAPDTVLVQLSLLNGSDCYSYNATASNGVSTVIVVGMTSSKSDEGDSSKVIIAVVVALVIFFAILVVAIAIIILIRCCKKQKVQRKFEVTAVAYKSDDHIESDDTTRNTEECDEPGPFKDYEEDEFVFDDNRLALPDSYLDMRNKQ